MQIHELTRKRPVTEGVIGNIASGVADVAGRGVMQKYGGTQGGSYGANADVSQNQAQGKATSLTDPLVKRLATSMKGTFKNDIQNQMKNARSPDNTPVTSASQLKPTDIKQALLGEITKMVQFDYNKLSAMVDRSAGNNTGAQMADVVVTDITNAVDEIVKGELNPISANVKLQDAAWMKLAAGIQSAKSIAQFQGANKGASTARTPEQNQIHTKADQAGLTPEKMNLNPSVRDPKTLAALSAMGFKIS